MGRGDVPAVILPNGVELTIALFTAWPLGAAVTPMNPALIATDFGAEVVIGEGAAPSRAAEVLDVAELRRVAGEAVHEAHADGDADGSATAGLAPENLALLIHTGARRAPKGVMLTHVNLVAMSQMMIEATRVDEDDHSLLILPCSTSTASLPACRRLFGHYAPVGVPSLDSPVLAALLMVVWWASRRRNDAKRTWCRSCPRRATTPETGPPACGASARGPSRSSTRTSSRRRARRWPSSPGCTARRSPP
ncbi:AMP-binding protein [Streptomyces atratus]|uniref:AMP-binding protein n=1 Tax=Streptomyces atratus TaxID=1893 RepID=UPI0033FCF245